MTTVNENQALLDSIGLSRSTTKTTNDMGSGDFLKLMLAQLRNQDPTNPMDNSQFLSQLAQFSTVTGVQDLNKSFASLSASLQSNQALQASSLVGRSVLIPSDKGNLVESVGMAGQAMIPASAAGVTVGVYDASGALVQKIDMGAQPAGKLAFVWDGKDEAGNSYPPGVYTVKATANIGGKQVALDTAMYDQVQSVDLGGGQGIMLNLVGLGTVNLSDVQQVM